MASTPEFADVPVIGMAQISTANTNRDGTGTIGSVLTGSANGTRVHRVTITATGTTTAGVIRLFIDNATNVRLLREILVPAVTPSTSIAVWTFVVEFPGGLVLPQNYILKASTNNAETFNVMAEGGNF